MGVDAVVRAVRRLTGFGLSGWMKGDEQAEDSG